MERIVSKGAELPKESELLGALNPRLAPPASALAAVGGTNSLQYCYKFSYHGTGEGGCTKGAACSFSHASEPAADKTAQSVDPNLVASLVLLVGNQVVGKVTAKTDANHLVRLERENQRVKCRVSF